MIPYDPAVTLTSPMIPYDPAVTLTSPMMPDGSSVYNFKFDAQKDAWVTWAGMIEYVQPPADAPFRTIIIPTVDTARYSFILDTLITNGQALLMVGPTGTGKSFHDPLILTYLGYQATSTPPPKKKKKNVSRIVLP
jgi:hypothetical protein